MAIDPKLVSIKTAGELPVSDPSENANFLFYEGETLQTSPMSNIYDKVSSGLVPATTTTVPEATGFHRYLVHEAGTYTNFGGIVVSAADLDIVNGVANNEVILEVNNGVASKKVRRLKGDKGDAADPAKLPLYSAIKTANIIAGTQFIDDENGNIQYRVKTGQTLLTSEIPANVVGTKVEILGGAKPLQVIGYSPTAVMSQKATTVELGSKANRKYETYLPSIDYTDREFTSKILTTVTYFDTRVKFTKNDAFKVVLFHDKDVLSTITVKFFQINGTAITVLHTQTFTGQDKSSFRMSDITYDFSAVVGDIYIGVSTNSYVGAADPTYLYGKYFTAAGLVAVAYTGRQGYYLVKEGDYLLSKIDSLEAKKLNSKFSLFFPDKSFQDIPNANWNTNLIAIGFYFDTRVKFTKNDIFKVHLVHRADALHNILVSFFQINGSAVTVLHTQTFTGIVLSSFSLTDITYDFSAVVGDIYIGLSTNGRASNMLGVNSYGRYYTPGGLTVLSNPSFFGYWIEISTKVYIEDMIKGLYAPTDLNDLEALVKANNGGIVTLKDKNYITNIPLHSYIADGTRIVGSKKSIITYTGAGTFFDPKGKSDITLEGFTMYGDTRIIAAPMTIAELKEKAGLGNVNCIFATDDCWNIRLKDLNINNFSGIAIGGEETHHSYVNTMKITGCVCKDNYFGLYLGTKCEYNELVGNQFCNNQINGWIDGGNNIGSTNAFNDGGVGLVLWGSGRNDSHGSMSSGQVNHNISYSIVVIDILLGYALTGFCVFDGNMYLENCRGFNFTGGLIACGIQVVETKSSHYGYNSISNNTFYSAYGAGTVSPNSYVSMKNNYFFDRISNASINNTI